MRIAGRLALESAPLKDGVGYHGLDVIIRDLSSYGFEAELRMEVQPGALVRLRLPGAGTMLARVSESGKGRMAADFLNPVAPARLGKTMGMMAAIAA